MSVITNYFFKVVGTEHGYLKAEAIRYIRAETLIFSIHEEDFDYTSSGPTRTSVRVGDHDIESPLLSAINHSFKATCSITSDGVVALKNLHAGEEITFNYLESEPVISNPFVDNDTGYLVSTNKAEKQLFDDRVREKNKSKISFSLEPFSFFPNLEKTKETTKLLSDTLKLLGSSEPTSVDTLGRTISLLSLKAKLLNLIDVGEYLLDTRSFFNCDDDDIESILNQSELLSKLMEKFIKEYHNLNNLTNA